MFRLGALAGSLLTRPNYSRLTQDCHLFEKSEKVMNPIWDFGWVILAFEFTGDQAGMTMAIH